MFESLDPMPGYDVPGKTSLTDMMMDPLVVLVENYFRKDVNTETTQKDLRKNSDAEPKDHVVEVETGKKEYVDVLFKIIP